jgi:hypothetical protein
MVHATQFNFVHRDIVYSYTGGVASARRLPNVVAKL